ncbi:hypothetical protein CAPTEDRAFT_193178 [Capitella teleta]|uniref:Uncharacterized protein n=1 Tax=Capitella teleta TaxID=283909 RepID=R7UNK0_CAPTE|nr:hypothetical protein CAPTEDRAFT_193178 [Capitella teleta]|eukprot:ELU07805.1 hypothetical protein CAPTEDRAFT_193178 [Capitella teleta]
MASFRCLVALSPPPRPPSSDTEFQEPESLHVVHWDGVVPPLSGYQASIGDAPLLTTSTPRDPTFLYAGWESSKVKQHDLMNRRLSCRDPQAPRLSPVMVEKPDDLADLDKIRIMQEYYIQCIYVPGTITN